MSSSKFVFNDVEFDFKLNMSKCYVLKDQFGINILNLQQGENLDSFGTMMILNDEKVLDLWWWIVGTKFQDKEACLALVDRDFLTKFKEAVWAGVINFSDPDAVPILEALKKQLPELLKKEALNMFDQKTQQLSKTS